MRLAIAAVATALALQPLSSGAVELNVTHFGTGMYGVPYAVAKEKGYFKEAGLDVTGFLTSAGGGTTVRNVLASELPYGDVALPAVIAAAQQGLELTIVHAGVASVADQVWITRKDDQRIKTVQDLAGKKLGYSSPKSVTDMITSMMLDANGLTGKVERKSIGGIGSGLTALREGAVDMTYVTQPVWAREKNNFRLVFNSTEWAPRVMQTVGVVKTDFLKKNPDLIRGIIEARRKGVEFIKSNPDESAKIMAKEYKITEAEAKAAIADVLSGGGVYWSPGDFDYEGMTTMLERPAAGEGGRARPVRLVEDRRRQLSAGDPEGQAEVLNALRLARMTEHLRLEGVTRVYPPVEAPRGGACARADRSRAEAGRVLLGGRALRLRQVHLARRRRRARAAERRHDPLRGQAGRRRGAGRRRRRVPGGRELSLAHRLRQRRLRAAPRRRARRGSARARASTRSPSPALRRSRRPIRRSSPAACASGSASRARW